MVIELFWPRVFDVSFNVFSYDDSKVGCSTFSGFYLELLLWRLCLSNEEEDLMRDKLKDF